MKQKTSSSFALAASGMALMLASQSAAAVNLRIIGGSEAQLEQYPFIAALVPSGGTATDAFCGASVLSPTWILTAAHCLEGTQAASVQVLTGADNLERASEGERIAVKRIINHPQYDSRNVSNDIALLELVSPTRATVVSAASAADQSLFASGQPVSVAGWGDRTDGNRDYPSQLHSVNLSISAFGQCSTAYGGLSSVHLCAGVADGSKDSCSGDSGGPLVARTSSGAVQVGIVSFGDACGSRTHPGVYTRVSEYSAFIKQYTGVVAGSNGTSGDSSVPVVDAGGDQPVQPAPGPEPIDATDDTDTTTDVVDATPDGMTDGDVTDPGVTDSDADAGDAGMDGGDSEPVTDIGPGDIDGGGDYSQFNTGDVELVVVDDAPVILGDGSAALMLEIYNGSDQNLMFSEPTVDAGVAAQLDDYGCLEGELQPDEACYIDITWDPAAGDLSGQFSIKAFDGATEQQLSLALDASPMLAAEFGDTLDWDESDYYATQPDAWGAIDEDSFSGGTALDVDLGNGSAQDGSDSGVDGDSSQSLLAEFATDEPMWLEFQYQLVGANCVLTVDDEALYYLSASDDWQQARFLIPANARVRWDFDPAPVLRGQRVATPKARLDAVNLAPASAADVTAAPVAASELTQQPANPLVSGGAAGAGSNGMIGLLMLGLLVLRRRVLSIS